MIKVVIHCSDSAFGNAALIAKWHTVERGWTAIGYHYVILNGWLSLKLYHKSFDGHLETGRALDDDEDVSGSELGAHTKGFNDAVGICLIGRSGAFTSRQMSQLRMLLISLRAQYKEIEILQHSDLDPTGKPHCAGLSLLMMDSLRYVKSTKGIERNINYG